MLIFNLMSLIQLVFNFVPLHRIKFLKMYIPYFIK